MRATTDEKQFWLCGYYDDFSSSRSIPDDLNTANARAHDHTKSHHGNPLNGEATINPRYRYSYAERAQPTVFLSGDPHLSNQLFVSASDGTLSNDAIHKWLGYDSIRANASKWEGRAQLQYPDSRRGSRQRFNGVAGDSYEAFTNGSDTRGTYYVPLGINDSTAGRSGLYDQEATISATAIKHTAGIHQRFDLDLAGTTPADDIRSISLAGVLMGEEQSKVVSTKDTAQKHLRPLTSPSGMPFLVHRIHKSTTGTERIMTYDGPLNFTGRGDTFNLRIAVHNFGNWTGQSYSLKIGYKSSSAFSKSNQDFSPTTHAATVNFTLANLSLSGDMEVNNPSLSGNDDLWKDIDVVFDFSEKEWKAYVDGYASPFASGDFNDTDLTESDLYGWSLDMTSTGLGSEGYVGCITCIDRAALYIPLNDAVQNSNYTPIESMNYSSGVNQHSSMTIKVLDDDNNFDLIPLIASTGFSEWSLMMFRDSLARPIWRGPIVSINHKQNARTQVLETTIQAESVTGSLDRQIPIWEIGQNTTLSMEQHLSLNTEVEKKAFEIAGMNELLNMGLVKLRVSNGTIGHKNATFTNEDEQRTVLNSAHPIQMYVNEDSSGPNSVEFEWEGGNSPTYKLSEIVFCQISDGKLILGVKSDSLIAATNSVTVAGTGEAKFDTNHTVAATPLTRTKHSDAPDETPSLKLIELGTITSPPTIEQKRVTQHEVLHRDSTSNEALVRMTTSTTHSYAVGDEVQFGMVIENAGSDNGDIDHSFSQPYTFDGVKARIVGVPSASYFDIIVTNLGSSIANLDYTFGGNNALPILDVTKYGSPGTDSKPAVFIQGLLSNATFMSVKNRVVHARWMRDLSESLWFKSKFGVIAKDCYWRGGPNTSTNSPIPSNFASNYTSSTSTMVGISSFTTSDTTIACDDPGLWYHMKVRGRPGIIDLIDPDTNEHNTLLASGVSNPSSVAVSYVSINGDVGTTVNGIKWKRGFQITSTAVELFDVVAHTGFKDTRLNGVFQVTSIISQSGGVTKYGATKIAKFDSMRDSANLTTESNSTVGDPDGMWSYIEGSRINTTQQEVLRRRGYPVTPYPATNPYIIADAPTTTSQTGLVHYGTFNLTGCKGQRRAWTAGSIIYSLRRVDESNGYKHCWVLWADMRNDGTADADGGFRKSDFGLQLPSDSNYQVSLLFANQYDENGELDSFTDLKIGEDLDLWALDADSEPFSGSDWSALNDGSDNGELDSRYSSWKSKGGAFCLIDTSRFFNMNTEATGGRPGYFSGGAANFGDYHVPISGTPYLLDNYWMEASSNYKISGTGIGGTTTTNIANHDNQLNFINDGQLLTETIEVGDTSISLEDITNFEIGQTTNGYGVILAKNGSGQNADTFLFAIHWKGYDTATDKLNEVFIKHYDNTIDPVATRANLDSDSSLWTTGSKAKIKLNDEDAGITDGYDEVVVYNTPAALYGLRLLMALHGSVKSLNSGTYFDSDKLRLLQNLSIMDCWVRNSHISGLSDINNIPLTNDMSKTQTSHSAGDTDSFGSVIDARRNTYLRTVQSMSESGNVGELGTAKTFSWLAGRDGRLDYRPSYNIGLNLTRDNMKVSDLSTSAYNVITNVRVFYNKGLSFVDYPEPTDNSAKRWAVVERPNIMIRDEAESIAKKEFTTREKADLAVSAQILRGTSETDIMLTDAKYGYLADPFRCSLNIDGVGRAGASWTSRYAGHPFPGMVNALDGSSISTQNAYADSMAGVRDDGETGEVWDHIEPISFSGLSATEIANGGKMQLTLQDGDCVLTWMVNSALGTSTTGVVVTAGNYYTLTKSGSPDRIGYFYVKSIPGDSTAAYADINYIKRTNPNTAYPFYGVNSLSHAMQIVHVPKGTPNVSAGTSWRMRFAIEIKSATTADDAIFTLHALDYSYSNTGGVSTLASTLSSSSSVDIFGNGFYELAVPSSYGAPANSKIIVSVNTDYLRAIIRNRMGSFKNAHGIPGLSAPTSTDTNSAFPLRVRYYTNMGGIAASGRAAWYAPRLNVVDDINYYPATKCTITDTHIDLSAQDMIVAQVTWSQKGAKHEMVQLRLERDEARYSLPLSKMFQNREPLQTILEKTPRDNYTGTDSVGSGDSSTLRFGQGINTMSNLLTRRIKGSGRVVNDETSSNSSWSILGQDAVGKASSADTSIDGFDAIRASKGTAVQCSDGFVLPGIVPDIEGNATGAEYHEQTMLVRIPNDASKGVVKLEAMVSVDAGPESGKYAVLTAKVECIETAKSISIDHSVLVGTSRSALSLLSGARLEGTEVAGNTLKITLSRTPTVGSDNANFQSLRIHSVSLSTRRSNNPTDSQTNLAFRPY